MNFYQDFKKMSNSSPIPISEHGQNYPNAYCNQAFSRSSLDLANSPQSPPQYLDPRSPRAVFPMPAQLQSPEQFSNIRNNNTESLIQESQLHKSIIDPLLEDIAVGLDLGTWGFLTYLEDDERVQSTYIKGPDFLVDNSNNSLNDSSLGLASLPSAARGSKAEQIRQAIHKGIVLSSDEYGNVYLLNESKVPVIIKGFNQPEHYCVSEDVIQLKGKIMPEKGNVKVFDIEEFRSQIGLQILNKYNDKEQLRHMSVLRMCFGEAEPGPTSPSWLLLVNIIALQMADSEEARTEVQDTVAHLRAINDKPIEKDLPSKRKKNEGNEVARRKTRIELRKQGKRINDHMKYSWDDVYYKKDESALNMEILKEQFEDHDGDSDDSDKEGGNNLTAEAQLALNLKRLQSIVKSNPPMEETPAGNVRPVKRWAKLSHMIKQREGAY